MINGVRVTPDACFYWPDFQSCHFKMASAVPANLRFLHVLKGDIRRGLNGVSANAGRWLPLLALITITSRTS